MKHRIFDTALKQKVVHAVMEGLPETVAAKKYNVPIQRIDNWVKHYLVFGEEYLTDEHRGKGHKLLASRAEKEIAIDALQMKAKMYLYRSNQAAQLVEQIKSDSIDSDTIKKVLADLKIDKL